MKTETYLKKTKTALKKLADKHFSVYIRNRDSQLWKGEKCIACITCGEIKEYKKTHAGHYYSKGQYPRVRYNEYNANGQCTKCNTFLHGNLIEYREALIRKIGLEAFDKLEYDSRNHIPFEKEELIAIIFHYRQVNKRFE